VLASTTTPPRTFPPWAIAGFGIAALLIGAGIAGLLVTRGRR
jgi:hypothetical protein